MNEPAPPEAVPAVILGGGPIGLVCALLLARAGVACELVDARPLDDAQRDRRLLALSRGTLLVLESLLGAGFAPMAPIERVRVSSRGEPGAATLGGADFPQAAVGATVWYADLVGALAGAAARPREGAAAIRIQRPRKALRVEQESSRVRVLLDDGATIHARLAVDAEGTPARARQATQAAMLAEVAIAGVAAGDAIERFTREGPLALLPLPPALAGHAAAHATGRLSMVWCQGAAAARRRLALDDGALAAEIATALGPRYARPTAIGSRHVFALTTHRLARICEHRLVHLGNAAQSLHPVAGQGFNLGIRDCACLAEAILDGAATDDGRADPALALPHYRRRRALDRRLMPALTSLLPPLFTSRLAPVAALRSAGLVALDLLPGPRRAFTRLLMFGAG
jgi:2-octaprenyl-6-methoxyphenol hydroxylase